MQRVKTVRRAICNAIYVAATGSREACIKFKRNFAHAVNLNSTLQNTANVLRQIQLLFRIVEAALQGTGEAASQGSRRIVLPRSALQASPVLIVQIAVQGLGFCVDSRIRSTRNHHTVRRPQNQLEGVLDNSLHGDQVRLGCPPAEKRTVVSTINSHAVRSGEGLLFVIL